MKVEMQFGKFLSKRYIPHIYGKLFNTWRTKKFTETEHRIFTFCWPSIFTNFPLTHTKSGETVASIPSYWNMKDFAGLEFST